MSQTNSTGRSRRSIASILAAFLLLLGIPAVTTVVTAGPAFADDSSKINAAVNWANDRLGQNIYEGLCQSFVHDAYSSGASHEIGTGYGSAVGYWDGHTGHQSGTNPPKGALVFWGATSSNPDGHVAISLGLDDGTVISSYERSNHNVHTFKIADRNNAGYPYLGWMMPPGITAPTPSSNTALASRVTTLAGNWSGSAAQDFMYVTPRSDGGSDFAAWESTPTGIVWRGSWASANNIPFSSTQYVPDDVDGDGLLDMLYATPRPSGGFDMGLMHNTGTNFVWAGTVWSTDSLALSTIKFMPGNWYGDGKGDLAYVTPNSNGGFDIAVNEYDGTNLVYRNMWWHEPNLAFNTTRFVPLDFNHDGLLDVAYTTPRGGTNGFDMSFARNTGNLFVWTSLEWGEPNIDYSTIRFIPGYFSSTTQQGFVYVTRKSNGGFDANVMSVNSSGHLQMNGSWWSENNLAYDTTVFVPADNNADGDTDLFYATPHSGGGFDLALSQNVGTNFSFVGQQWNPTNLALGSTKFMPQF